MVVTITTPFEPLEPYIAVADASFKTSIDSMSFGCGITAPTKPSTTISGALLALIEVFPLIFMLMGAPGSPPLLD